MHGCAVRRENQISFMNNSVTVVIPVKNEAQNLLRCIEAVATLGSVVVVDSGSTDDTRDLAKSAGAEVLDFEWDGQFPKKRNWTLCNYDFKTDWVIFLDADEFVSSEFIAEVKQAISNTEHVGFLLHFENYFMGQHLEYGDTMRKLALFRVGAGKYERIEEGNWSHLDMEVHEHPVLEGSIGEVNAPIEHRDFRGLKHYIAKHNEYSSWEAARYLRLIGEQGTEWQGLTARQKKKYRNLGKWWFAPAYFMATYFLKRGFLDGQVGFYFALMKAIYFFQIRLKIREFELVE